MTSNNVINMNLEGSSKSHARTDILARDVESVIDEPVARGGTNLGLTPTETLVAALIGCTNVISHRIIEKMGFKIFSMDIKAVTKFNRDGVGLIAEVEVPFPEERVKDDGVLEKFDVDLNEAKKQLSMFCPIAKVIRNSGTVIIENWKIIS